jgi:hypothetical protein
LSRASQHGAVCDIELAAVAGTGDDHSLKITIGKRALEVRARVTKGVKRSANIGYCDAHAANVERRQLALSDFNCVCQFHELGHSLLLSPTPLVSSM